MLREVFRTNGPTCASKHVRRFLGLLPRCGRRLRGPGLRISHRILCSRCGTSRPANCNGSRFCCRLGRGLITEGSVMTILTGACGPKRGLVISFTNSGLDCISVRANRVVGTRIFMTDVPCDSCACVVYIPSRGARSFLCTVHVYLRRLNNMPPVLAPSGLGSTIADGSQRRPQLGGTLRSVNGCCRFIMLPYSPTSPARGTLIRSGIGIVCGHICTGLHGHPFVP